MLFSKVRATCNITAKAGVVLRSHILHLRRRNVGLHLSSAAQGIAVCVNLKLCINILRSDE